MCGKQNNKKKLSSKTIDEIYAVINDLKGKIGILYTFSLRNSKSSLILNCIYQRERNTTNTFALN